MQRRGGGSHNLDVEGGDAPAFGRNFDDDDKKNNSPNIHSIHFANGMGTAADFGRVFQGGAGPDDKFFLDLRDKLLVAGGVGFLFLWLLMGFYVAFVFLVCLGSLAYAADLTAYIMACDAGTTEVCMPWRRLQCKLQLLRLTQLLRLILTH